MSETVFQPVWNDAAPVDLPALPGDVETDVCVVGLGGSGLACIRELLVLGQRVVGIDAAEVAAGAAGSNGGFLLAGSVDFYHDAVNQHGRDRALAVYRLTLDQMARMREETPDAIRMVGSLRIAMSDDEGRDCEEQLRVMQRDGLEAEWYSGREGEGLLIASDGVFQPALRCRTMARRAMAEGARLFTRTPALDFEGTTVVTPLGRIACARVIVAVDGRLEQLLPELVGAVRTARLQMLATAPTGEVRYERAVYARYGYEYWQQLPDGRVALGGFRDRGGEGEWTTDVSPSEPVQGLLEAFLRERLDIQAPITHRWAASVGYTESGLPVLREVRPGVWAIGGYSGTGNVVGAICGRAVAQTAVLGSSSLAEPFVQRVVS